MIKNIDEEIWSIIRVDENIRQRKYICGESFAYFLFYYFADYFTYTTPDYHYDFIDDCERIVSGELRDVLWIAFRESAKTTIAKFFVLWCICYKKKKYIAWDSYDGTNAESAVFDITVMLQTNKKILRDFGYLYRKKKAMKTKEELEDDSPEIKRGSVFITTNRIKVECFTTQISARGRVSGKNRPDLFVYDDIENNITKESIALTQKVIRHTDEVNTGLQNTGSQLFLGNYITEEGSIAHIRDRLDGKHGKLIRDIPMVIKNADGDRVPAWPGKYVMSKKEAYAINQHIPTREEHVIAIEQKREDWGDKVFETEAMNDPGKSGDYFFDREKVRAAKDKAREPLKEVAGFKTWATFNPTHRYGLGADVAEGVGGDSSTTVTFDYTQRPALVVGTYKDNEIPPNLFAHEIIRHARFFGECFVLPEINSSGFGTVTELITEKYYNMYRREVKNKTSGKIMNEYGWKTSSGNKYDIFAQLKTAFEEGEIEILDIDLLNEMYHYTKAQIRVLTKAEMTRHYDLVMAAALGWEARRHATLSKEDKKDMYKSPNAGAASVQKPYII